MSLKNHLRTLGLLAFLTLVVGVGEAPAQLAARTTEEWVKTLETPDRISAQKIDQVLAKLNLKQGIVVADIGAGSGLFTRPLSKSIGPNGKVYAVDIQKELLDYINQRDKAENIKNVQTVLGEFDDPKIPAHDVDVIFINDVLHHIQHRAVYLKSLSPYLKPNGRVVIIDMNKDDPNTAHKNQPELLIAKEDIGKWMSDAGFKQVQEYPDVFPGTRWFLVYAKK